MVKSVFLLAAAAIAVASMRPAYADSFRSSSFDGTRSTNGYSVLAKKPYGKKVFRPHKKTVIIQRWTTYPYRSDSYQGGTIYPASVHPRTVIVAPRARTVIIRPARARTCGTTIYGSAIASPVPVDPYTGIACR